MSARDIRIAVLTLSSALLAALAGCKEERAYVKPLLPVRVATVRLRSGGSSLRYSTDIRPRQQIDLAFRMGGYLQEVTAAPGLDGEMRLIQEGDPVRKDGVLARLRQKDYEEKVNQVQGKLAEAEAAEELSRIEHDRAERLLASSSLTKADYDGIKARWSAAKARTLQARGALEEARLALEDCALRSPIDGILMRRRAEPGAFIAPGVTVFSVGDLTSVEALFGVPDLLVGNLHLGDSLQLSAEAIPGHRFEGRVTRISPWADPRSRVFEVQVSVPNAEGRLRAGMIATLTVPDPTSGPSEPVVPLSAVVRPPGSSSGYGVFVVEEKEGAAHARHKVVELGSIFGTEVTVVSGVAVGEKVIETGATLVIDGQQVRVLP